MLDKILGGYDCMLVGASVLFATFAFASAFEFGTGRRLWRWLVIGIVCAGLGFGSRYFPAALRANLRLVSIAVLIVSLVSIAVGFCSAWQSKLRGNIDAYRGQRTCTERNIHIHG
jgi:NO-binding membrane sensor protein with MHYT domain